MDWNAAIERNREALKRVLAMLVAMAGLAPRGQFTFFPQEGAAASRLARPEKSKLSPALTLPRHLHRAVLRLLRPTEAAVRRLVIVMARGLVVKLPPARERKPKPKPTFLRNGVGTGILMPRGYLEPPPLTPPHKGEGVVNAASGLAINAIGVNASESPSPLWGGVRGGGKDPSARHLAFQLLDPLPRWRTAGRPVASGVPRISFPGFIAPHPVAVRRPPSPDDAVDAARLALRLAALASALDDLPGHARRFAGWQARRDKACAQDRQGRNTGRTRRLWPLRPGRPPGGRRRPAHEVHEVLRDLQWFAVKALERTDTS
jgi:hypothetical protein